MQNKTCPDRSAPLCAALHTHARQVRAYCLSMSDTLGHMPKDKRQAMGADFVSHGATLVAHLRRLIGRASRLQTDLGVNREQMDAYADEAETILRRFAGTLSRVN